MILIEYYRYFKNVVDEYLKTNLVLFHEVKIDMRTEKLGLIKGQLVFIDNSKLYFMEYLDFQKKVEKISYSFHYQNNNNRLIFRYDNAKHFPPLQFKDHKHTREKIIKSEIPDIDKVLSEIIGLVITKK